MVTCPVPERSRVTMAETMGLPFGRTGFPGIRLTKATTWWTGLPGIVTLVVPFKE